MAWEDKPRPYPISYYSYWTAKGEYGKERIRRMQKRKADRQAKRKEKKRTRPCPCCGQYPDDNWCW